MSSYTVHTDKSWQATMQELNEAMSKWGVKEWDTNYPRGAHFQVCGKPRRIELSS